MNPLLARLREPSSWAGVSVLLALFGVRLAPETLDLVVQAGAAVAALAAVVVKETGRD